MPTNAEFLSDVPLFAGLSRQMRERLGERCTKTSKGKNEELFREGDEGSALYVIIHGRIRLEQVSTGGDTQTVAVRTRRDVIGEMALLEDRPRLATAICEAKTNNLLILGKSDFYEFVLQNPEASIVLLQTLSRRIREMSTRLFELRTKSVADRILSDLQDRVMDDGIAFFPGNQTDWANLIGCEREVLNRNLQALQRKGAITKDGPGFRLK